MLTDVVGIAFLIGSFAFCVPAVRQCRTDGSTNRSASVNRIFIMDCGSVSTAFLYFLRREVTAHQTCRRRMHPGSWQVSCILRRARRRDQQVCIFLSRKEGIRHGRVVCRMMFLLLSYRLDICVSCPVISPMSLLQCRLPGPVRAFLRTQHNSSPRAGLRALPLGFAFLCPRRCRKFSPQRD